MTSLTIEDLEASRELDQNALGTVVGGGNHYSSFYYGAVKTGNWGSWQYKGYSVLGNTWMHGNLHQIRKYKWTRYQVNSQDAWRYGYID